VSASYGGASPHPLCDSSPRVHVCVTSATEATHSCCCIASIASHVLSTLDMPVCNASRRLPRSPSTSCPSTSNTTTRYRLGLSYPIFSSSWLPRGPANLHRALVLRLSPQIQCSSPCRFHWTLGMLPDTPKHRSNHPAPVHWEVSPHPPVSTNGSSLHVKVCLSINLYISDFFRHASCWSRNSVLSINPSLSTVDLFLILTLLLSS